MELFAKRAMSLCKRASRNVSGQTPGLGLGVGVAELGHFDKHFVKNAKKA